jgi:hypothetical protein
MYTTCEVGKGNWLATRARALARLVGVGIVVGLAGRRHLLPLKGIILKIFPNGDMPSLPASVLVQ